MIYIHRRRHGAGNCHHIDHDTSCVTDFLSAGLTNYVLSIVISWPHIAISVRSTCTASCVLTALLDERLRSIFAGLHIEVPSNTTFNNTNSVTNIWPLISPISNGLANRRRFLLAAFTRSLTYTMRDQRTNLLEHLLGWGLNMNGQSSKYFVSSATLSVCHRSIWQNWLAAAVLKVRPYNRVSRNERSDGVRITLENVKESISDIVALLLRYGANPDCAICIHNHHDFGPCRQVSLESTLETITPQDRLDQIQNLRAIQSTRFDRRAIQHRQMRRALQSWKVSKHKAYTQAGLDISGREILVGFVQNMIGVMCSDCSACTGVTVFAMALCLDCLSSYQLCENCIDRRPTYDPTLDRFTEELVHESSASDGVHASIYIGCLLNGNYLQEYGQMRSISVLEDWYARNTNDEETALD